MEVNINCMYDTAIHIASEAHAGQVDKAGQPYILHPIRLSMKFESLEDKAIMCMHDIVEDSKWIILKLEELGIFSDYILNGIKILTHNPEQSYFQYIDIIYDSVYRKHKIMDLEDNMNILRYSRVLTKEDFSLIQRYHKAWLKLSDKNHT